jgi:hypothetical protein
MIVCCRLLVHSVFTQQDLTLLSLSLLRFARNDGRRTVPNIFTQQYSYHITFISLLTTFENSD